MFGVKDFIIKIILVWSVVTVVLVESSRQKKDVHHMIILDESTWRSKNHRHTNYVRGKSDRSKKKPNRKNKYHLSGSSRKHTEKHSAEEVDLKKPDVQHNRNKNRNNKSKNAYHKQKLYSHENSSIYPGVYPVPDGSWNTMTSQEFFARVSQNFPAFPGRYYQGAIQPTQAMPLEITTPPLLHSNSFESSLYPSLNTAYDMNAQMSQLIPQSLMGTGETYNPFDYSILEKARTKNIINYPDSTMTPQPFKVGNVKDKDKDETEAQADDSSKKENTTRIPRGRSRSRYGMRKSRKT